MKKAGKKIPSHKLYRANFVFCSLKSKENSGTLNTEKKKKNIFYGSHWFFKNLIMDCFKIGSNFRLSIDMRLTYVYKVGYDMIIRYKKIKNNKNIL